MSATFSTFDAIQTAARYIAADQSEKARDVLEPLVNIAPGYAVAHVLFARACEGAGDVDAARKAWRYVAQLVPTSPLIRREQEKLDRRLDNQESAETPPFNPTEESEAPGWAILHEEETISRPASPVDVEAIAPDEDEEEHAPIQELEETPVEESPSVEEVDAGETSTEPADALTGELDTLISRLGNASRITPGPDPRSESETGSEEPEVALATDVPSSIASETLADVYATQGQYEKAAETYERLAEQKPNRVKYFKKRAAEMRSKA